MVSIGSDVKISFCQIYNPRNYQNICDLIKDYESVQNILQEPRKGPSAVLNALNLPRGRILSWVDGDGMPDCYRGLQTALSND